MAIPALTENLNYIQSLPDKPPMIASEVKKEFDQAGNVIKDYIANILIPAIEKEITNTKTPLINNLSSSSTTSGLTALQGKNLKDLADKASKDISSLTNTTSSHTSSINSLNSTVSGHTTKISNIEGTNNSQNTKISNLENAMGTKQKKISYGYNPPSGGSDGDIYIQIF